MKGQLANIKVILDQAILIIKQQFQKKKTRKLNKKMHVLYIDFQKAYDNMYGGSLINTHIRIALHFPYKLINLIKLGIMETSVKILIGTIKLKKIQDRSGLTQRGPLSPILFNIALEKVIRKMKIGPYESVNL